MPIIPSPSKFKTPGPEEAIESWTISRETVPKRVNLVKIQQFWHSQQYLFSTTLQPTSLLELFLKLLSFVSSTAPTVTLHLLVQDESSREKIQHTCHMDRAALSLNCVWVAGCRLLKGCRCWVIHSWPRAACSGSSPRPQTWKQTQSPLIRHIKGFLARC